MSYSVGKAIREINSNKISKSYLLSGDDYFLQDFFIKRLKFKLNEYSNAKHLNFEEENDRNILLNELDNISLFSNKAIYIIRNFNKISMKLKNRLFEYISSSDADNILVFISDDYYSKNKFISSLSEKSLRVDTRTPFSNKVKEWVNYYIKTEKINIDRQIVEELIDSFNENISSIINEIDKLYLYNNGLQIKYEEFDKIDEKKQNIRPWNLIDSIGSKNDTKSIEYLNKLFLDGFNIIVLIMNLSNFFKVLLLKNVSSDYKAGYNGLNKIINNRMNSYSSNFSIEEISNIVISIKNIDVLCKSTSLNHKDMLVILIIRICKGHYAK